MKKVLFLMTAVAVAAACALAASAQGPGGPPAAGRPAGPGMPGIARGGPGFCAAMALAPPPPAIVDRAQALQLTQEQKTKLRDILAKGEEALVPLRQKAADASRALREAVLAPQYDAAKVKQLSSDAARAEEAVVTAEIRIWGEVRLALSVEQFAKLQDLMSRRFVPGAGGNRPGGWGGPGGQPAGQPP
ncbi:MAG: Spy/CpxP family protein refolding chaperone [Armatimonadota bacterium]